MLRWLVKKIMKEEKTYEDILINNRFDAMDYRINALQKDVMRLNKSIQQEDRIDIIIHLDTREPIELNVTKEQQDELYRVMSTCREWIKLCNGSLIKRDDIRYIERTEEKVYTDGMMMGMKMR